MTDIVIFRVTERVLKLYNTWYNTVQFSRLKYFIQNVQFMFCLLSFFCAHALYLFSYSYWSFFLEWCAPAQQSVVALL